MQVPCNPAAGLKFLRNSKSYCFVYVDKTFVDYRNPALDYTAGQSFFKAKIFVGILKSMKIFILNALP